jgi:hypothetical protein
MIYDDGNDDSKIDDQMAIAIDGAEVGAKTIDKFILPNNSSDVPCPYVSAVSKKFTPPFNANHSGDDDHDGCDDC